MQLHNILTRDSRGLAPLEVRRQRRLPVFKNTGLQTGFTLVEILVVIGIFTLIMSLGLFLSMDFYRTFSFNYERNLLVASLQAARSRALANINESPHGLHFDSSGYIIFEGASFNPADPKNQNVPTSYKISVSGPNDIIFSQLSADVGSDISLSISGSAHSPVLISINREGGIEW
jgi:prepilin-type N-terminal cleavage/methylation domain-containing protein